MNTVYNRVSMWAEHLSMQEWLMVFLVAVVIGAACLKGFGSRNNY